MSTDAEWPRKLRCCLIAQRAGCRGRLEETVEAALGAGVGAVQLREKQAATRELFDLARMLRVVTRRYDALLLINDRADVALAVEADGVHLGWQSMPVDQVRRLVGGDRLIGKSVHNLEEARAAAADGVDYVFAGPVFDTPSKAGVVPTLGLDGLRAICREIDLPVIGLGGIDSSSAAEVVATGARGVAVIRAILAAADPAGAAAGLLATLAD